MAPNLAPQKLESGLTSFLLHQPFSTDTIPFNSRADGESIIQVSVSYGFENYATHRLAGEC